MLKMRLHRYVDTCIDLNLPLTGRWPDSKLIYWLTEALLLILQSVSELWQKVKGQRKILVSNNNKMSNNSDTVYNAPADRKSKVWKRFGHLDKSLSMCEFCRTAVQSSGSTIIWKLSWWDGVRKTTLAMNSLWVLTLVMLQLAQAKCN